MAIAAVGQICSTASLSHNLEQCVRLVAKAAIGGAKVPLALTHPGPKSPFLPDNNGNGPAQILLYPSAFTIRTGQAHWETLLRARAIETQSWVVAAAQVGAHNPKRSSYGHSMVVDPWGRVKLELGGVDADGSAEEGAEGAIGFVDVDLDEWAKVREGMPLARRT
ncbi:Carbon-nitrogen hydrolase [Colletotrichum fioriniae]|uniref:Carbon-nitrogen hydrolase n=1 Tax=Colletotrichum fioriniae TaxID=710243 RepID=UPI0032DA4CB3|nr:Carbon-nitrogen hydrolase [Colletotrichum fioriniae]